jgi:hypothetical protein
MRGGCQPGHFDHAPGKERIAPDAVTEPRLPLNNEHFEPRSGQSGAERGSGNAAADYDDIKVRQGHESAPAMARLGTGCVSRRAIIRLGS